MKSRILDANVDGLNLKEAINLIKEFIASGNPHSIITANSLMVNCISGNPGLKKAFDEASLVVTDSIGIVWASKYLNKIKLKRIPGIDLMKEMCSLSAKQKYRVYLLGAQEDIVKKAEEKLKELFPGLIIAGTHHGYFKSETKEEKEIINTINEAKPDMVFVGLDVPRQEVWINRHLKDIRVPISMGVGGSFDVISGRLKRAPLWSRKMGFEWIHRFLLQPWRIIRLMKLPVFVIKVILQKYFHRS